jgi:hypothetical protein
MSEFTPESDLSLGAQMWQRAVDAKGPSMFTTMTRYKSHGYNVPGDVYAWRSYSKDKNKARARHRSVNVQRKHLLRRDKGKKKWTKKERKTPV